MMSFECDVDRLLEAFRNTSELNELEDDVLSYFCSVISEYDVPIDAEDEVETLSGLIAPFLESYGKRFNYSIYSID